MRNSLRYYEPGFHLLLGSDAVFEKHTYFRDVSVCSKAIYRLFA